MSLCHTRTEGNKICQVGIRITQAVSVLCTVTGMDLIYCTGLRCLNNGIPKDEAKDKHDNSLA